MPAVKQIIVDGQTYDIATEESRLASEFIHKVYIRTGKPNRLDAPSAWILMDALWKIWMALYPWEVQAFKKVLIEDQSMERTPHEAQKAQGGHIPISYPTRLYHLIKLYFPEEELADRNLIKKFTNRYPLLKITKYKI